MKVVLDIQLKPKIVNPENEIILDDILISA